MLCNFLSFKRSWHRSTVVVVTDVWDIAHRIRLKKPHRFVGWIYHFLRVERWRGSPPSFGPISNTYIHYGLSVFKGPTEVGFPPSPCHLKKEVDPVSEILLAFWSAMMDNAQNIVTLLEKVYKTDLFPMYRAACVWAVRMKIQRSEGFLLQTAIRNLVEIVLVALDYCVWSNKGWSLLQVLVFRNYLKPNS